MSKGKITIIDWLKTAIRPLVPMFSQQDEADFHNIFKNAKEQYNEHVSPLNEKFLKLDDEDKEVVEWILDIMLKKYGNTHDAGKTGGSSQREVDSPSDNKNHSDVQLKGEEVG